MAASGGGTGGPEAGWVVAGPSFGGVRLMQCGDCSTGAVRVMSRRAQAGCARLSFTKLGGAGVWDVNEHPETAPFLLVDGGAAG